MERKSHLKASQRPGSAPTLGSSPSTKSSPTRQRTDREHVETPKIMLPSPRDGHSSLSRFTQVEEQRKQTLISKLPEAKKSDARRPSTALPALQRPDAVNRLFLEVSILCEDAQPRTPKAADTNFLHRNLTIHERVRQREAELAKSKGRPSLDVKVAHIKSAQQRLNEKLTLLHQDPQEQVNLFRRVAQYKQERSEKGLFSTSSSYQFQNSPPSPSSGGITAAADRGSPQPRSRARSALSFRSESPTRTPTTPPQLRPMSSMSMYSSSVSLVGPMCVSPDKKGAWSSEQKAKKEEHAREVEVRRREAEIERLKHLEALRDLQETRKLEAEQAKIEESEKALSIQRAQHFSFLVCVFSRTLWWSDQMEMYQEARRKARASLVICRAVIRFLVKKRRKKLAHAFAVFQKHVFYFVRFRNNLKKRNAMKIIFSFMSSFKKQTRFTMAIHRFYKKVVQAQSMVRHWLKKHRSRLMLLSIQYSCVEHQMMNPHLYTAGSGSGISGQKISPNNHSSKPPQPQPQPSRSLSSANLRDNSATNSAPAPPLQSPTSDGRSGVGGGVGTLKVGDKSGSGEFEIVGGGGSLGQRRRSGSIQDGRRNSIVSDTSTSSSSNSNFVQKRKAVGFTDSRPLPLSITSIGSPTNQKKVVGPIRASTPHHTTTSTPTATTPLATEEHEREGGPEKHSKAPNLVSHWEKFLECSPLVLNPIHNVYGKMSWIRVVKTPLPIKLRLIKRALDQKRKERQEAIKKEQDSFATKLVQQALRNTSKKQINENAILSHSKEHNSKPKLLFSHAEMEDLVVEGLKITQAGCEEQENRIRQKVTITPGFEDNAKRQLTSALELWLAEKNLEEFKAGEWLQAEFGGISAPLRTLRLFETIGGSIKIGVHFDQQQQQQTPPPHLIHISAQNGGTSGIIAPPHTEYVLYFPASPEASDGGLLSQKAGSISGEQLPSSGKRTRSISPLGRFSRPGSSSLSAGPRPSSRSGHIVK